MRVWRVIIVRVLFFVLEIRFGANSPVKGLSAPRLGFGELQEKAKAMLTTAAVMKVGGDEEESASGGNNASAAQLMQFIEDFCREGDRVVDENKRDKGDLQKQVRGEGMRVELSCMQLSIN